MAKRCGTPASREETLGGVGGWGSEEGAAARNLLPLVLVGGWRSGVVGSRFGLGEVALASRSVVTCVF
jgi:hypothetical protein